jgi:glycosyltransferase involved in cell wall biosynthesis
MTEPHPRASVVITTRDRRETALRAVRSMLRQSEARIEVIVIDDGSTDGTFEAMMALDDARVRCLRQDGRGIPHALNAGLRAASAPVVVIQDDDDESDERRVERQLALLEARPDVAVVGVRMREVDPQGVTRRPRTLQASGDVTDFLLRDNPIPNTSAAFRREDAVAVGGYDERYRWTCDYDLWLRLAERHRVYVIPETLATRHLHGANASALNQRAQLREGLSIRARAMARRRRLTGLRYVVRPAIALAAPTPLRRAVRRSRRQVA